MPIDPVVSVSVGVLVFDFIFPEDLDGFCAARADLSTLCLTSSTVHHPAGSRARKVSACNLSVTVIV